MQNLIIRKDIRDILDDDYVKEPVEIDDIQLSYQPMGWKDFNEADTKMLIRINLKRAYNQMEKDLSSGAKDRDLTDSEEQIIEQLYNVGVLNKVTMKDMLEGKTNEFTLENVKQLPAQRNLSSKELKFIKDKAKGKKGEHYEGEKISEFESDAIARLVGSKKREALKPKRKIRHIVHAPKESPHSDNRFFEEKPPEPGDTQVDLDWKNLMRIPKVEKIVSQALTPTYVGNLTMIITAVIPKENYVELLQQALKRPANTEGEINSRAEDQRILDEILNTYYLEDIKFNQTGRFPYRNYTETKPERSPHPLKQKKYKNPEYIWHKAGALGRQKEGGQRSFTSPHGIAIRKYIKKQVKKLQRMMGHG